jgi:hypothetical protein
MAEMLVEENPELCMDDAANEVSEWYCAAGGTCIESGGYAPPS